MGDDVGNVLHKEAVINCLKELLCQYPDATLRRLTRDPVANCCHDLNRLLKWPPNQEIKVAFLLLHSWSLLGLECFREQDMQAIFIVIALLLMLMPPALADVMASASLGCG